MENACYSASVHAIVILPMIHSECMCIYYYYLSLVDVTAWQGYESLIELVCIAPHPR